MFISAYQVDEIEEKCEGFAANTKKNFLSLNVF